MSKMCIGQRDQRCTKVFQGKKTNFVIRENQRGDSVVYLISRLPGRTRKKSTSISTSIAERRDATIYRYSINHFGSYFGILARDKSLNGRIPAKRDGTERTIRMKYNDADKNFSEQKRTRAFPRPRHRAALNSRIGKSKRQEESYFD